MIKEYIEKFAQVMNNEFFQYQLERYQPIKIHSYKEHPEVKKVVEQFLEGFTPQIKDCYRTAAFLVGFDHRFKYVCGYTHYMIPIDHAWNSFGDFHFDLTAELAIGKDLEEYGSIRTINYEELSKLIDKREVAPSLTEIFRMDKENHD